MDKPDGHTVWHPNANRNRLSELPFDDIPGIGGRMQQRLWEAGITDMEKLMATSPKEMRALWGNVTGERLWYALQGYAVKAQPSKRGMYGHGRVLPPDMRTVRDAYYCSRILLVKAARRMRRDGYYPGELHLFEVGVNEKWETISESIDHLNWRYGKTSVSIGPWNLKYGKHLGTKIAFTRIPRREDAI